MLVYALDDGPLDEVDVGFLGEAFVVSEEELPLGKGAKVGIVAETGDQRHHIIEQLCSVHIDLGKLLHALVYIFFRTCVDLFLFFFDPFTFVEIWQLDESFEKFEHKVCFATIFLYEAEYICRLSAELCLYAKLPAFKQHFLFFNLSGCRFRLNKFIIDLKCLFFNFHFKWWEILRFSLLYV